MLTMLLEDTNKTHLDDYVAILLVALFFLFCIGAVVLFIFGIRKDRKRLIAEKFKIREMDKNRFIDLVKHKYEIANEDLHFTVIFIKAHSIPDMKLSLGERQVKKILETLKERVIRVIPHGSKICNYEEDVLAVYIEEHMDNKGLSNIATVAISECNKPVTLITRTKIKINVSLGIASNNDFSPDAVTLLQNVEISLNMSIKGGFNKFAIYSAALAETQTEEYKQYQEIKNAIEEHQFTLYYQPIVQLETGKVIAYETLARWNHPTLGLLTPYKFLPIMEQTGDINWIGGWAFDEMLRIQTRHMKEHPEDENLIFTMNLSPKQLMYPHLAEEFRKIYKRYRIPAKNICMEIVEFAMFDKVAEVSSNILKLTQMGFKIAVDDFGLEMSSLKMLDDLQFDWVKLDRKFIEQAKDDFLIGGVVGTLVNFAEKKGFIVVAEGVEDDITLDYVKGLKIGYGQGYFYGKPLPRQDYGI